ncbi:PQQ-dependent sugar dehydrogenase [Microbacterium sp. H1-D42]|uniref:PQQ-dependent sugar dehydrogenase n=1 Tax=Microbacterium sp. H1-D42 TaxID=2925844 RepID=UPI001F531F28|nr:PQQ-dependent sugar dehydrogenase [Microbacterium sp. H1-D42]UNK70977.1 PQQ-dependent sugar dehydrogenase [Microbacterium sp. H1-D42]
MRRDRWAASVGILIGILIGMLGLAACTDAAAPPSGADPAPPSTANAEPVTLAQDLDAPWSVLPLPGGGALISQRDDGHVIELTSDGEQRDIGTVPDVVSGGESGLHGLALHEADDVRWLYAYHGAENDNRVVRMPLTGDPGALTLDVDKTEVVLDGIPRASNHNGGRIAFGPDGMLYIATGDAGRSEQARDPDALAGKILRVTPEGEPAPGNPFGTAVYSLGHRNVQGLAWDSHGTLWASEFGQNTWDELNRIEAGGDYGWPDHEGMAGASDAIDPVAVWQPSEASPSGIAMIDDVVYLASLRGERVWLFNTAADGGEPWAVYTGEFGRLRDVAAGPHGSFWVLTNNTDGRGDPREGDDRLLQLTLPEG